MATTRTTSKPTAEPAADVEFVAVDGVSVGGGPIPGDEAPAAVTAADPVVGVTGSEPPPVLGEDPRTAALAAYMAPAPVTVSDVSPPVPQRALPPVTGIRSVLHADGDPYLVCSSVYPRVVDDVRTRSFRGTVVVLRDDDRTQSDVANGYLYPLAVEAPTAPGE